MNKGLTIVRLIELSNEQMERIDQALETYDKKHFGTRINGSIQIGIDIEGKIVAGAYAVMTAFHILYLSTLYVDEPYRKQGLGKILMDEIVRRGKNLQANLIRVDTFDFQAPEFYQRLGFEQVGFYHDEVDKFSEYFFIKRL